MGRGRAFSPLEEELLRENYDKTIAELEELFTKNGYDRSRKSINRKLEKMREEGVIGFRSKATIKRSYKQRTRSDRDIEPTKLDGGFSTGGFETGESSFADSDSGFDNGEAGFDTGVSWEDGLE